MQAKRSRPKQDCARKRVFQEESLGGGVSLIEKNTKERIKTKQVDQSLLVVILVGIQREKKKGGEELGEEEIGTVEKTTRRDRVTEVLSHLGVL